MKPHLRRDDETGIAYLQLADVGPGAAIKQRTVSLSEDEDSVDLVLDFDSADRLLGIEFLNAGYAPPGW